MLDVFELRFPSGPARIVNGQGEGNDVPLCSASAGTASAMPASTGGSRKVVLELAAIYGKISLKFCELSHAA